MAVVRSLAVLKAYGTAEVAHHVFVGDGWLPVLGGNVAFQVRL